MFKVIVENYYESIMDFQAWSGGKQTLDLVRKKGLENELQELFEASFDLLDSISEDTLNDWLWFDVDIEELEHQAQEQE